MGCGILYRMVAERIGLSATLTTRRRGMVCECFCESESEFLECGDSGDSWGRIQVTVDHRTGVIV
jgi:hypothetical protein